MSAGVQRIAAFADGAEGGNPAGVMLCDVLPAADEMQRIAAQVGYSETVFAAREGEGYRVRYFAPAMEVPFCGHATIALGAALGRARGAGRFALMLNDGVISVEARDDEVSLQSPPTRSVPAGAALVEAALALFGLSTADLDPRLPPAIAEAGARHLLLALADRETLAAMRYGLEAGRSLMASAGLVTIALVQAETPTLFHARNAFAAGGVYEDPATGAAAAALGGYLRDLGWPHDGRIEIRQGVDMEVPSRLYVTIPPEIGASVRVSGRTRAIA